MAKKTISTEALGRLEQAGNPAEAFLTPPDRATSQGRPATKKVPSSPVGVLTAEVLKAGRMPSPEDDPDLKIYTLTELEEILGLSHRSLLEYVKNGKLKARKIGTKWRVSRRNLLDYIHGTESVGGGE